MNKYYIKVLIAVTIIFNVVGLCFPVLRNDDPMLYANIAKNMLLNGDWINLMQPLGSDWLDKPHLPFWITALSFKILGINSFAYDFPAFIFNLIGTYYTFLLGKYLYNKQVGFLASLIYLSSFHLILSSTVDVRAEAYLMGMITPACYYWLLFFKDISINFRYLLKGALFTACGVMTKGIFVFITISSGILSVIMYKLIINKQFNDDKGWGLINSKLILKVFLAICLSIILIIPEILALYVQFDLHPEKVIYHNTNVSGVKWFLWDSQLGRFFNTGPITRYSSGIGHYFYFIHTYLWAFLPWSMVFVFATYKIVNQWKNIEQSEKYNYVFLLGSFCITFILFSLTSFQLDYYTNIIMPFAAIICASWIYKIRVDYPSVRHPVFYFQIYLAVLLCVLPIIGGYYVLDGNSRLIVVSTGGGVLILFGLFSHLEVLNKAVLYPVLAINYVFLFLMLIYGLVYANYDFGYKIAQYLNEDKKVNYVVDFELHSLTLQFYTTKNYIFKSDVSRLAEFSKPFYLVSNLAHGEAVQRILGNKCVIQKYFTGTTIDRVISGIFNKKTLEDSQKNYIVLLCN
ncbi:MAG: glycosyltransferase family 39 protein [Burkholderiales bacterium]|nr:glycosyltransferase family 39 protein [Burkholderiales bacterium]